MHRIKNCIEIFTSNINTFLSFYRNEKRVCFADTVSVSKLAEIFRNHHLKPTSDLSEVENILQQSTIKLTNREQIRQFDGKNYWFHRILLDNHIQFPIGISQNAYQARRLAYRHMIDVCLNDGGVKMKMLTGQRVKVVKGPKVNEKNRLNTDEFDINGKHHFFRMFEKYLSNFSLFSYLHVHS